MRKALVCLLIVVPASLALLAVPAAGGENGPYPPSSTTPTAAPTDATAAPARAPAAAPAEARAGDGLAVTGSETWLMVWGAVAALALGTALVVGTRRRAATRASLRAQ